MFKNKLRNTLVLAALAGIVGTVTAATVTTNNSAAACVALSGSLSITGEGRAENPGTSAIQTVCPIERPVSSNSTSATVWAVDRSSANVCCRVVAKNPTGGLTQSAQVCSTGSQTTAQPLTLAEITDTATYSSFFVLCDIPAVAGTSRSGIALYRSTTH